jgi:hypothetical protein
MKDERENIPPTITTNLERAHERVIVVWIGGDEHDLELVA